MTDYPGSQIAARGRAHHLGHLTRRRRSAARASTSTAKPRRRASWNGAASWSWKFDPAPRPVLTRRDLAALLRTLPCAGDDFAREVETGRARLNRRAVPKNAWAR